MTVIGVIVALIVAVAAAAAGYFIGYNNRKKTAEAQIGSAEAEATRLVNEAIKTADQKRKEAILEAKDEAFRLKAEVDAHRQQASAQAFQLFVEEVSQRHDRHPEGEIEHARRLLIARVADSCAAQKDDHGDESQQHGVQQRQPRAAVDRAAQTIKPHGEGQQKEVRGEERGVRHRGGDV